MPGVVVSQIMVVTLVPLYTIPGARRNLNLCVAVAETSLCQFQKELTSL